MELYRLDCNPFSVSACIILQILQVFFISEHWTVIFTRKLTLQTSILHRNSFHNHLHAKTQSCGSISSLLLRCSSAKASSAGLSPLPPPPLVCCSFAGLCPPSPPESHRVLVVWSKKEGNGLRHEIKKNILEVYFLNPPPVPQCSARLSCVPLLVAVLCAIQPGFSWASHAFFAW